MFLYETLIRLHPQSAVGIFFLIMLLTSWEITETKRVPGRGRKGKVPSSVLPFPNVAVYSSQKEGYPPKGARIRKASHFAQTYKLGYKILLICEADGDPRPSIRWYKDGAELPMKMNTHLEEMKHGPTRLKSRVEIDPATIGDQGVYTCLASNSRSSMLKNFKAEYTF